MREPPHLEPGDAVAVAAPSACFDRASFERGIALLRGWGFRPVYRRDIFARHRYFAGSERRRREELQGYLDSAPLKAILFARGGFGLHTILPSLRFGRFQRYPKRLIGYSDLTLLLHQAGRRASVVTYYGPTVCDLGRRGSRLLAERLRQVLLGHPPDRWSLRGTSPLRPGRARGVLVGGCLTLLSVSVGTPFEVATRNRILLLEDTAEEVYRVERMLLHLKQAGKLRGVRGILISDLNNGGEIMSSRGFPEARSKLEAKRMSLRSIKSPRAAWHRMIREVLADFPGPVVYGARFGHCASPVILPLGRRVCLDTKRGLLSVVTS